MKYILPLVAVLTLSHGALADESHKRLVWEDELYINANVEFVNTPYGRLICKGDFLFGPKSFKGVAAGELVVDYDEGVNLKECKNRVTDFYFREIKGKNPLRSQ